MALLMNKYLKESNIIVIKNFLPESLHTQVKEIFESKSSQFQKLIWKKNYSQNKLYQNEEAIVYFLEDNTNEILNILKPKVNKIADLIISTFNLKASSLNYNLPSILWKVFKSQYFPPHHDQFDHQGHKFNKVIVATYNIIHPSNFLKGGEFCVWDYYIDQNKELISNEFPNSYGVVKRQTNSLVIMDIAKLHQIKPISPICSQKTEQIFSKSFYFRLNVE